MNRSKYFLGCVVIHQSVHQIKPEHRTLLPYLHKKLIESSHFLNI